MDLSTRRIVLKRISIRLLCEFVQIAIFLIYFSICFSGLYYEMSPKFIVVFQKMLTIHTLI